MKIDPLFEVITCQSWPGTFDTPCSMLLALTMK